MRKLSSSIEEAPPRRSGWRPAALVWIASILVAAPLALDGARLVAVRWGAMFGPATTVDTPAIDLARMLITDLRALVGRALATWTTRLPWPVDYAAAGLLICAVAGTYFLKRGRWS